MRLFAAVPVSEPARSEITALLDGLRKGDWPVRWVHQDGLHLTLKFFGEVAPERLEVIAEPRRPRIVWVGVDAPPALELLQDRLERSTEAIGFPPEGVPFHPHLTLGRVREGHRLPAGAIERLASAYEPVGFLADQVVLYESVLGRGAPQYQARLTLELAG
jgi:2'-5' RNA ligase